MSDEWGTDLRLREAVDGVDLVPRGSGDLARASGVDNVVQALWMRLRLRRGELAPLGWPDHGSRLHELLGERNLARAQARAIAFAREAVQADSRVVAIPNVRASVPPGARDLVRIEMDLVLSGDPATRTMGFDVRLEP
jgi:phage gp46-like protein